MFMLPAIICRVFTKDTVGSLTSINECWQDPGLTSIRGVGPRFNIHPKDGTPCNTLLHLEGALHDTHLHREFASLPPLPRPPIKKHPYTLIGVMLILHSKSGCNWPRTVGVAHRSVNYSMDYLCKSPSQIMRWNYSILFEIFRGWKI